MVSFASAAPSSTRLAGRVGCGRRSTAASRPSANRRRTRSAVRTDTPSATAIAPSVSPSAALSSTRARVIFRADSRPVFTSRSRSCRCSSVNTTACVLGIRASLLGGTPYSRLPDRRRATVH